MEVLVEHYIDNQFITGAPTKHTGYGNTQSDYQTKGLLIQQNFALDLTKYILTLGGTGHDRHRCWFQLNYLTRDKIVQWFFRRHVPLAFTYKLKAIEVSCFNISQVES